MKRVTDSLLMLCLLAVVNVASAYEIGDWSVHGTLSQGWIHSENNNFIKDSTDGSFDFREAGLNASRPLGENGSIGAQVFTREWGAIGNHEVYLDWANITYAFNDAFGIRAGKLRIPYGLYGETRDIDSLRTQILLPQGVYIESYRESISNMWGVQAFGNISTRNWGDFDYALQVGGSDIDNKSGELNRLAGYLRLQVDDSTNDESGAFKLFWMPPLEGLRLGVTYSWNAFAIRGRTENLLGLRTGYEVDVKDQWFFVSSAEYTRDRATVVLELLDSRLKGDTVLTGLPTIPFKLNAEITGHYVSLNYAVSDRITAGVGYSGLTVEQYVSIPGLSGGVDDDLKSVYASFRYDFTPNLIAKFEQHFSTGKAALFVSENMDGLEDDWSMSLFKLSFVF